MTILAVHDAVPFQDLKNELQMSDGNLITHLRSLQNAGYLDVQKEMIQRPQSRYTLTDKGRTAFKNYINVLEQIVKKARG